MKNQSILRVAIILVVAIALAGYAFNASARSSMLGVSPTLGDATSFSVLAGQEVTNTGTTIIEGDLGVSPGTSVTGNPTVEGTIYQSAETKVANAQIANSAAFDFLDQTCDTTYTGTKDLVGETLVPGVYCADAFTLTGTLTLSGTTGVWIFKSGADLITSGTANIIGGDPCNVWWRVVSSATLGSATSLKGSVLAYASISMATGATLEGRVLAQTGTVSLQSNTITIPVCTLLPTTVPTNTNEPESEYPTATVLPSLPEAGGGAPIRDENSPFSSMLIVGASILALALGGFILRRTISAK